MRRLAVGLLTALALAAAALPVAAESVDRATYQRLVVAAPGDPAALARLRAVTAVDGRPVDLRGALDGSPARVACAAGGAARGCSGTVAGAARRTPCRRGDPRRARLPPAQGRRARPGALVARRPAQHSLGRGRRRRPGRPGRRHRGGRRPDLRWLLGSARRTRRRESRFAQEAGALGVGSASPEELDRRAAAAEAAGRFEEAMRLQLAAALTRLDEAGAIHVRRDTTVGQVARSLGSPDFDAAAERFAGVVYGRRPPTIDDAADLRRAARGHRRRGAAPMSDSRRLILIGIAVLAVLGALRAVSGAHARRRSGRRARRAPRMPTARTGLRLTRACCARSGHDVIRLRDRPRDLDLDPRLTVVVLWPDVITAEDAPASSPLPRARRQARGRGRAARALARRGRGRPARLDERAARADAAARRRCPRRRACAASPPASRVASSTAAPRCRRSGAGAPPWPRWRGSVRGARSCSPIRHRSSTAASRCATTRLFALERRRPGPPGRVRRERARLRARERLGRSARALPRRARAAGPGGRRARAGARAPPRAGAAGRARARAAARRVCRGPGGRARCARAPAEAIAPVVEEAREPAARSRGRRRRRVARGCAAARAERGRGPMRSRTARPAAPAALAAARGLARINERRGEP